MYEHCVDQNTRIPLKKHQISAKLVNLVLQTYGGRSSEENGQNPCNWTPLLLL